MMANCLPHFGRGSTFWKLLEVKLLRWCPEESPLQCGSQKEERYASTINRRNHTSLQSFKNCWKKIGTQWSLWGPRDTDTPGDPEETAKSAFTSRLKINLKEKSYLQRLIYIIFLFLFWPNLLLVLWLKKKKKKSTNFFSNRTKLWNLQIFLGCFDVRTVKEKFKQICVKATANLESHWDRTSVSAFWKDLRKTGVIFHCSFPETSSLMFVKDIAVFH